MTAGRGHFRTQITPTTEALAGLVFSVSNVRLRNPAHSTSEERPSETEPNVRVRNTKSC